MYCEYYIRGNHVCAFTDMMSASCFDPKSQRRNFFKGILSRVSAIQCKEYTYLSAFMSNSVTKVAELRNKLFRLYFLRFTKQFRIDSYLSAISALPTVIVHLIVAE